MFESAQPVQATRCACPPESCPRRRTRNRPPTQPAPEFSISLASAHGGHTKLVAFSPSPHFTGVCYNVLNIPLRWSQTAPRLGGHYPRHRRTHGPQTGTRQIGTPARVVTDTRLRAGQIYPSRILLADPSRRLSALSREPESDMGVRYPRQPVRSTERPCTWYPSPPG